MLEQFRRSLYTTVLARKNRGGCLAFAIIMAASLCCLHAMAQYTTDLRTIDRNDKTVHALTRPARAETLKLEEMMVVEPHFSPAKPMRELQYFLLDEHNSARLIGIDAMPQCGLNFGTPTDHERGWKLLKYADGSYVVPGKYRLVIMTGGTTGSFDGTAVARSEQFNIIADSHHTGQVTRRLSIPSSLSAEEKSQLIQQLRISVTKVSGENVCDLPVSSAGDFTAALPAGTYQVRLRMPWDRSNGINTKTLVGQLGKRRLVLRLPSEPKSITLTDRETVRITAQLQPVDQNADYLTFAVQFQKD
jgi:hypothetical protein